MQISQNTRVFWNSVMKGEVMWNWRKFSNEELVLSIV